jgi:hypothetical protein
MTMTQRGRLYDLLDRMSRSMIDEQTKDDLLALRRVLDTGRVIFPNVEFYDDEDCN